MQRSQVIITKEVIMQTKINSVAIRATNATGAGKTSTLKIGDKIIVTVTPARTRFKEITNWEKIGFC
jgi:hypothetical protein